MFIRRRGVPPNRKRAPPGNDPNAFYVYDDGSIYSNDGTLTGLSANFSPDELCEDCAPDALSADADNFDGLPLPPAGPAEPKHDGLTATVADKEDIDANHSELAPPTDAECNEKSSTPVPIPDIMTQIETEFPLGDGD